MTSAFTKLTFTAAVKAAQYQYGSRAAYARLERSAEGGDVLGLPEAEFIQTRDGFYQATVSETGWPYVQFRGGPAGFLKVLDATTLVLQASAAQIRTFSTCCSTRWCARMRVFSARCRRIRLG